MMQNTNGTPGPEELAAIALELRRIVLRTTHRAGMGHTGGSLSEADILTALYFGAMRNLDPAEPRKPDRDRFVLSKGHASPGYYAALALRGYFSIGTMETFDELGSTLQAHPDMRKTPGVDMSTGSLGQGLSCAVGMAEASRRTPGNGSFRTFALLGDGESQEGQVWEAALFAGSRKTPFLIAITDNNRVQLASATDDAVPLEPLADKWRAFGWYVIETDGHDMERLLPVLLEARERSAAGPVAVIAHTVKGKGVSFMEGKYEWHGKAPDDAQFAAAMKELER